VNAAILVERGVSLAIRRRIPQMLLNTIVLVILRTGESLVLVLNPVVRGPSKVLWWHSPRVPCSEMLGATDMPANPASSASVTTSARMTTSASVPASARMTASAVARLKVLRSDNERNAQANDNGDASGTGHGEDSRQKVPLGNGTRYHTRWKSQTHQK